MNEINRGISRLHGLRAQRMSADQVPVAKGAFDQLGWRVPDGVLDQIAERVSQQGWGTPQQSGLDLRRELQ
ncbi:hypothetical protein K6N13_03080 [Rhizobium sp. 8Z]|nr:hypothetical protein [Rhizobium sp. BK456]MBY4588018.1 hypothetical protein [Rhizobium redzepovicii]MBY4615755.1 hypothetical protein [Rhizobium redzepovicii]